MGSYQKFLDEKGEVTLNQMKKGIKADPNLILQAIGWLAREDKLIIEKKGSLGYLFLEKMNGVYNKPGSNNWVLAAKQVLEDLEERKIN